MNKLEKMLEEAYDDLETVDRLYDNLTQYDRQEIDYCIKKRLLVCDRIKAIRQEIELETARKRVVEYWNNFILGCMGLKKESPVTKQNDSL